MNFIFFFPDEMRADDISCYGHPLVQMPNYDRLAQDGVRFEQCHVQHTVCSPSRCSLFTGWYPHVAGHRTLWHLLRPHEPNLLRYLHQAGYHVEWFGKNDVFAPECFAEAVDHWESASGGHSGPNAHAFGSDAYYAFDFQPFEGKLKETSDMKQVQGGIDFLRSRQPGDAPFFLFLPLSMPHPPYGAPEPFHSMYAPEDVPDLRPTDLEGKPDYYQLIRSYRHLDQLDEGVFRHIRATYLGMNSYCDWMLGQLLNALDETGLAEETCLIVSSDHGDWAGDYGLVEKWPSALDDCLTRVPLLVRLPGGTQGRTIEGPVELMDLMPTVLELAGITPRHTHFATSLLPELMGQRDNLHRAVYAEGGYDLHEPHCFEGRWSDYDIPRDEQHIYWPKGLQQQEHPESVCRSAMVRTQMFKLVQRTNGVCELYDLERDPLELDNVYRDPRYTDVQRQLEADLLNWYMRTADVTPMDENPRGLPGQTE